MQARCSPGGGAGAPLGAATGGGGEAAEGGLRRPRRLGPPLHPSTTGRRRAPPLPRPLGRGRPRPAATIQRVRVARLSCARSLGP
eukprot:292792-Heterocapsa_arctica.AAC.1